MKKIIAIVLIAVMALAAFTACKKNDNKHAEDVKGAGVMTHEQYVAAEIGAEVVVETYVQAKQSWWDNKGTFYTQDKDGAYFIYEMGCTEEEYNKLVPGTKIKVTGHKAQWPESTGIIEIIDAKFEIEEGNYVAEAFDATALFGTDDLAKHMAEYFTVKSAVIEAMDEEGAAFWYNWDNSGEDGSDLYFKVKIGEKTYTFTVESYLCDKTTEVYNAVKNLKVGDTVDILGFLYWYEGVNPHVTGITVK